MFKLVPLILFLSCSTTEYVSSNWFASSKAAADYLANYRQCDTAVVLDTLYEKFRNEKDSIEIDTVYKIKAYNK